MTINQNISQLQFEKQEHTVYKQEPSIKSNEISEMKVK